MTSKTMEEFERTFAPTVAALSLREVERDDPNIFDNGLVVYQKGHVRIRLVVDRGSHSVEVSSTFSPDRWSDLQPMMNRIWKREQEQVPTPEEFSSFVAENFQAIKDVLTD